MLGARRWYVVEEYVSPNNIPEMRRVEQVMGASPKGLELILIRYLNARLRDPREKCEEDLATVLVDRGLVNMIYHFMPQ